VIANHFLEHCENPILALKNMLRVAREGGIVYIVVPDKRYTFDRDRPVTSYEHLKRDFEEGPAWSRQGHYEEYVRLVTKTVGEEAFREQTNRLLLMDYSIHFHVWTELEIVELLWRLRAELGFPFDTRLAYQHRNEVICILKKVPFEDGMDSRPGNPRA